MKKEKEQKINTTPKEKYKQFIESAVKRAKQNSWSCSNGRYKQLSESSIEYKINSELLDYRGKDYNDFAIFAQDYCSKNDRPLTALLITERASEYVPEMQMMLPQLNSKVAERYENDIEFSNNNIYSLSTEYGKRLAEGCNNRFSLAAQHYSTAGLMKDAMRCELKSNNYVTAAEIAEQEGLLSKEEIKEIYEKGFEYEWKEKEKDYDVFKKEVFEGELTLLYEDKNLGVPSYEISPDSLEICAEKLGLMDKVIKFYESNDDPFSLAHIHSRQGNDEKLKEDLTRIEEIRNETNWKPPESTFFGGSGCRTPPKIDPFRALSDFSNGIASNAWNNIHNLLRGKKNE